MRYIEVFYPEHGFGESLHVLVEEGQTLEEAIQESGDAQYEFIIVHA